MSNLGKSIASICSPVRILMTRRLKRRCFSALEVKVSRKANSYVTNLTQALGIRTSKIESTATMKTK